MTRVSQADVEAAISGWTNWALQAELPTWEDEEWKRDHRAFVLGVVLPAIRPPLRLWRIMAEAYLAGAEAESDGSSVVPDGLRYGRIKDPQGVMHDYLFALHRDGVPDAFGHFWGWNEANVAYRNAWVCDGQPVRGWLWYIGLAAGSWPIWVCNGPNGREGAAA